MRALDRSAVPRLCAVALFAATLLAAPAAAPADKAVDPLLAHLEGLDVAPAMEHRLLVVHPITARVDAGAGPWFRAGGLPDPDRVAFARGTAGVKVEIETVALAAPGAVFFRGDLLRTQGADYVVVRDVAAVAEKPISVPALRISREADDQAFVEAVAAGPLLPTPLRHLVLTGTDPATLTRTCGRWAEEVGLDTARRSPVELGTAPKIAARVAAYRKRLAGVIKRDGIEAGRDVIGYAALVDGALACVETFADPEQFRSSWPHLSGALAVEAAVTELHAGLLTDEMADSAEPDRFVGDVKARLLQIFGARLQRETVRDAGTGVKVGLDGAVASAYSTVQSGVERVAHFVLVTDPARRRGKSNDEGIDPNVAERKARQTEEEKRLLERREGRRDPELPQPSPR
jgi:hypothetical protein